MKQKKHELLGLVWDYPKPVSEIIAEVREQDAFSAKLEGFRPRIARIETKLFSPALRHLDFGPISVDDVRHECEQGVDLSLEYFNESWWRPETLARRGMTQSEIEAFNIGNILGVDKSRSNRKLKWYDVLVSALFLGGLVGRWDDLTKICSWFDSTIEPEYKAGEIEDEYMQLFICIAGSLSPQPMAGAVELLAKVKKCRTKRPRLLCAAWEAANAADQSAFDKAFKETVAHFLSKREGGNIHDWVANHQSIIWLIAERQGLKFPKLPEKLEAAVVTRQSIGFAE